MIRLIPPEPPRRLVFPADTGDTAPPPSSETASPVSHVARRRMPSAPAEEVELEDLELFDAPTEARKDASSDAPSDESGEDSRAIPASTSGPAVSQPQSLAPLTIDPSRVAGGRVLPPMPVSLLVPTPSRARGRSVVATGGAVVMLALGIAIGAMLRTDGMGIEASALAARSEAAPPPAPTQTPEAPATVPVVAVSSLPRASVGTVIGAEGHRLWVDGHLAESFTAVVPCGNHLVQVGSAGTPRDVDVPCGEGITVLP